MPLAVLSLLLDILMPASARLREAMTPRSISRQYSLLSYQAVDGEPVSSLEGARSVEGIENPGVISLAANHIYP